MTTKKNSTTKPAETVEVEAPVTEVKTEAKPRISRLERARMALEAAEAKESERRTKKLEAVLARRAATMAVLSSNHDKLAGVDNELEELIGHDAFVELALPGPVCDQWTDENSYFTLSNGRMETVAHVKKFYELHHGLLADATPPVWPAYLEHEGKVHKFMTEEAFQQALENNVPPALYGRDVTGDITDDTPIESTWVESLLGAFDETTAGESRTTVEIVDAETAAEVVPV